MTRSERDALSGCYCHERAVAGPPASRRATVGAMAIQLKPKEFDLLVYLARHPDQVFSRSQLLREVWGYEIPIDTRTVDVHVRWLRQKLTDVGGAMPIIETSRGVGYRLSIEHAVLTGIAK